MPRTSAGVRNARKPRRPSARELFVHSYIPDEYRAQLEFLAHVATPKQFVAIVETRHHAGSVEYTKIREALDVALVVFKGSFRKTGEPTVRHSMRCALKIMLFLGIWDADVIESALLHDVTEKERRKWNIRRMSRVFGRWVGSYVCGMTRPKEIDGKRNKLQVDHLTHRQLARAVLVVLILKGVDRGDNIETSWLHTLQEVLNKNAETDEVLIPLLEKHQDNPVVRKLIPWLRATMDFAAMKKTASVS